MQFIRNIVKSTLFKVGLLNNISLLIRLLTGVVSAKLIAIFVGPAGMAFLGNFRNFTASLEALTTMGFNQGVVKYVAEHKSDKEKMARATSTVFIFIVGVLLLVALALIVFRERFNETIFGGGFSFEFLFIVLAFAFPLQVLNGFFLAVINGLERYKTVIQINIIGNILGFILTACCLYFWHLNGALLALVVAPAFTGICSYAWVRKDLVVEWKYWNTPFLKSLFSYSVMAVFSAVLAPLCFFYIRTHLMETQGLLEAGYWEALLRISGFYMLFVVTFVSVYFLPKLSIAATRDAIKKLLAEYRVKVLPVFACGLLVFYLFRSWFITLLLDTSFLPLVDLIQWQIAGDLLKAFSMIYGILFYAKKLVVPFIITEFMSYALFYISSLLLTESYGVVGVPMAHCLTYLVYSVVLVLYFTVYLRKLN